MRSRSAPYLDFAGVIMRLQACRQLKTAYRDGTAQLVFEPLDFIAGLAAPASNPRVKLTRPLAAALLPARECCASP